MDRKERIKEDIALGCTIGSLLGLLYIEIQILIYKQVLYIEPNPWILIAEILALLYALYYNIKKI